MIREGRGMVCLAMTEERASTCLACISDGEDQISTATATAYTVTIDAAPRFGVTTGISAQDRADDHPRCGRSGGSAAPTSGTAATA